MKPLLGGPDHPVVVAPADSRFLCFPNGFELVDSADGAGISASEGPTFPRGFVASGVSAGLKESGRLDMGVLAVAPTARDEAVSAAMFTTNAFAAAPVVVDREDCDTGGLLAIVVNSGNANACTGAEGITSARSTQQAAAEAMGLESTTVAVASTGIIGVQLNDSRMIAGVSKAAAKVRPDGGRAFAESIMTTDRFAKMCAGIVETPDGLVRIGACTKGAGMISPAMATMLCFVTTDAMLSRSQADHLLKESVQTSFNRVTVDGEMSTNDSVFLLASGASGVKPSDESLELIAAGLQAVLLRLALMMVADGEGATKIMRLRVVGGGSEAMAELTARAIADSPLVKTAMNGADANWGRVMSAAGAALAGHRLPDASLELCGVKVVEKGAACPVSRADRSQLTVEMKLPEVDIKLDLGLGDASAEIFFADMGHEYVTINAEYHS